MAMNNNRIHVVAGVIVDSSGPKEQILIAKRPDHVHQGGLWEFPGGKLEPGESVEEGLRRELKEELDIDVRQARPLIRIYHDYPDKSVLLDVWRVESYSGQPHGRERQLIEWLETEKLSTRDFPVANQPILMAASLPELYLITPDLPEASHFSTRLDVFLKQLEASLAQGIRLMQLRTKTLSENEYITVANEVLPLAHSFGCKVLLNGNPALVLSLNADGVQLSSNKLSQVDRRPLPADKLVAASCHNQSELNMAGKIGADFCLLSPVKKTTSHPDTEPLGWAAFQSMTERQAMPVYALGGLSKQDLSEALQFGAQGVSGIRSLWEDQRRF